MLAFVSLVAAIPAWSWPSEPVKFHGEALLTHVEGLKYESFQNLDVYAVEVSYALDFQCWGHKEVDGNYVSCTFDSVKMGGRAQKPEDVEKLRKILDSWSEQIKSYTISIPVKPDGRMTGFDLQNTHPSNQRESFVVERQRLVLLRLFCLFNLQMPKTTTEWEEGWKHKGWKPEFTMIYTTGTYGSMDLLYAHKGEKDGNPIIEVSGKGMISTGEGSATMDCNYYGNVIFDEKGLIYYRNYYLDGQYTSSAGRLSNSLPLIQQAAIQRIDPETGGIEGGEIRGESVPAEPAPAEPPAEPAPPTPPPTP